MQESIYRSDNGVAGLMRHLRQVMATSASGQEKLDVLVRMIAENLSADVCSLYLRRTDDVLELFATEGLNSDAVHRTTLRIGEGIIGYIARTELPLTAADATNHERFAHRPETGEDKYQSMTGVPLIRNGRCIGVLAVQNMMQREFLPEEVEVLQTVAMALSEIISGMTEILDSGTALRSALIRGVPISDGIAIGNAFLHEPYVKITKILSEDPEYEHARLKKATESVRSAIDELTDSAVVALKSDSREIMETYRMFAQDKGWYRRISEAIVQGLTAEAAVERVRHDTRAKMTNQPDPYLRERYHDFDDLANRLLRALAGKPPLSSEILPERTILIAQSLGPADLFEYDLSKVKGIAAEETGQASHVAILARALNIPCVGRAEGVYRAAKQTCPVIVDAELGEVLISPSPEIARAYDGRQTLKVQREAEFYAVRNLPAVTRDKIPVKLMMNAGLSYDLPHLADSGADGIGLLRTELNFMMSQGAPSAEEQSAFYKQTLDVADGKPVIFRTLDLGGDKVFPLSRNIREENPALGWRAVRMTLDKPALLRLQARALIRAAEGRPLSIMFPMVAELREFLAAKALFLKECEREKRIGGRLPEKISFGAMAEAPSIVWRIASLRDRCDFLSVGSNDLLQFYFAADRGNPKTASRYDRLSSSFLSFLRFVVEQAQASGIPLSICGEMAGKPIEALALLGVGFRNLSLGAGRIGAVKLMARSVDLGDLTGFILPKIYSDAENIREELALYAARNNVII